MVNEFGAVEFVKKRVLHRPTMVCRMQIHINIDKGLDERTHINIYTNTGISELAMVLSISIHI